MSNPLWCLVFDVEKSTSASAPSGPWVLQPQPLDRLAILQAMKGAGRGESLEFYEFNDSLSISLISCRTSVAHHTMIWRLFPTTGQSSLHDHPI